MTLSYAIYTALALLIFGAVWFVLVSSRLSIRTSVDDKVTARAMTGKARH